MPVMEVSDATFEREVLRSELPVLIDLYADWCQPCKQLSPIVQQVSEELEGKLKVVKIDVDRSPMIAQSFRVQSIPMLAVIAEGKLADTHVGMMRKDELLGFVKPFLPAGASEIEGKELVALLKARRVVPVDVRDESVWRRARIPGAINLPKEQVLTRAKELRPVDGRIRVLYGRTADDAKELVEKLAASGVEVAFLAGGFLHWEADGFEIERGTN